MIKKEIIKKEVEKIKPKYSIQQFTGFVITLEGKLINVFNTIKEANNFIANEIKK